MTIKRKTTLKSTQRFQLVNYLKENIDKWEGKTDKQVASTAKKALGFEISPDNVGNIRREPLYECTWKPMGSGNGGMRTQFIAKRDLQILASEFLELCVELGYSEKLSDKFRDMYCKLLEEPINTSDE